MSNIKIRIEGLKNGTLTTNLQTGDKEQHANSTATVNALKQFIAGEIEQLEPGVYFDVTVEVKKQRLAKPKA